MSENSSIVKLNLRGTRFETLSSTLSKDPNSILGQIIKPDYPIPLKPIQTQDGYYFFDRSPACFQIILDFLSKDKLEEDIPKRELLRLEDEAKFFKLEKLEQEITSRLLQIEMEGKLCLNGNNHDVKRSCDVIKFNVSGTIFHIAKTTLLTEHPDCLLTQYVKGVKEQVRDADGNIFLQKHLETYRLIFSFLTNGKDFEGHRKELIQGDINLLWTIRKEFVNLNLMDFAKHIYFYLDGRFKGLTFVSLKDKVWTVVIPSGNMTLGYKILNSGKSLIDKDGIIFLDICEKEMDLLYKRWDNTIFPAQYQNGKYNKEHVSVLARKLGFITQNEVVADH